jgi:hypothetical protein
MRVALYNSAVTCAGECRNDRVPTGSVGNPFDGDPRAGYLLIEGSSIQIIRVDYDVEREARLLLHSGYPDAPRIAETRRSGKFVHVSS